MSQDHLLAPSIRAVQAWSVYKRALRSNDRHQIGQATLDLTDAMLELNAAIAFANGEVEGHPEAVGATVRGFMDQLKRRSTHT